MHNAYLIFRKNITEADALIGIYDYLNQTMGETLSFDDLLRSNIVYSVSAIDKLIHDLVRIGIVQSYIGNRPMTQQCEKEPIPITMVKQIIIGATPPEILIDQLIRDRLKFQSFQDPGKISDGLNLIWNEKQKWLKIANSMHLTEDHVKKRLRLIVTRRNAIVHEADIDPISGEKLQISKQETVEISNFLQNLGTTIFNLVK